MKLDRFVARRKKNHKVQDTLDAVQDRLADLQETVNDLLKDKLDTAQDRFGAVQETVSDLLQDKLDTAQDRFGTAQEKVGSLLQDRLDTAQQMVNSTLQDRVCSPAEPIELRRKHNWMPDIATGIAALLLVGLFAGLTRNSSSARYSRAGLRGDGMGRVDAVGPTGVYPASATNSATPLDAEAQGMADWGHTAGTAR